LFNTTGGNTAKLAVCAALWLFLLLPQISTGQEVAAQDQGAPKDPPAQGPSADRTPTPAPAQNPTPDSGSLPAQPAPHKTDTNKPQNDRLFLVLPNYTTVEGGKAIQPLTTKEKFQISADGIFDPAEFAFVGVVALVNQATNDNPEWHQGLKGYARRYGNAFANQAIGNINTGAIWPTLLKQDPRYFQLQKGSFTHRFLYSATRIVVTRTDSGHATFNFSELLGNMTAAGISNVYQPRQERSVGNTMDTFGTQILYDTLAFELREFWPDLKRKVTHKSK
jgi:hypothetical protein